MLCEKMYNTSSTSGNIHLQDHAENWTKRKRKGLHPFLHQQSILRLERNLEHSSLSYQAIRQMMYRRINNSRDFWHQNTLRRNMLNLPYSLLPHDWDFGFHPSKIWWHPSFISVEFSTSSKHKHLNNSWVNYHLQKYNLPGHSALEWITLDRPLKYVTPCSKTTTKGYVAISVCLATKWIHL